MSNDAQPRVAPRILRHVWPPRVSGLEHLPRTGPVILASNHLSTSDTITITTASPRRVVFLGRAEWFTSPGVRGLVSRTWYRGLGVLPVDREDTRAARASLETALAVLEGGGVFGIYPEGSRSRDGRLYRARTGVAHLALTSGAPVVPVGLAGTERLQPIGSIRPRLVRPLVVFGEPMVFRAEDHVHRAGGRLHREIADQITAAVQRLTGQDLAHTFNERPLDD